MRQRLVPDAKIVCGKISWPSPMLRRAYEENSTWVNDISYGRSPVVLFNTARALRMPSAKRDDSRNPPRLCGHVSRRCLINIAGCRLPGTTGGLIQWLKSGAVPAAGPQALDQGRKSCPQGSGRLVEKYELMRLCAPQ
jgi:hypothetical protein